MSISDQYIYIHRAVVAGEEDGREGFNGRVGFRVWCGGGSIT